jgi:hypothetical protein
VKVAWKLNSPVYKDITSRIEARLDELYGSREVLQEILIVGIICIYSKVLKR